MKPKFCQKKNCQILIPDFGKIETETKYKMRTLYHITIFDSERNFDKMA